MPRQVLPQSHHYIFTGLTADAADQELMALSKLTHVLNAKLIDDRLDQARVCTVAGFKIRYRVFVGLPRFLLPLGSVLLPRLAAQGVLQAGCNVKRFKSPMAELACVRACFPFVHVHGHMFATCAGWVGSRMRLLNPCKWTYVSHVCRMGW